MARFPSETKLMSVYSPDVQTVCAQNIKRSYLGAAPALGLVKQAYGSHVAYAWAEIQIQNVEEFAGVKEKLTDQQRHELAVMIQVEYGYLKLTELALFFYRLKMGKYGRFYGSVDPMLITEALCEFVAERSDILARYEMDERNAEAEKRRAESAKDAVSYDEWVAIRRKQDPNFKPLI